MHNRNGFLDATVLVKSNWAEPEVGVLVDSSLRFMMLVGAEVGGLVVASVHFEIIGAVNVVGRGKLLGHSMSLITQDDVQLPLKFAYFCDRIPIV